MKRKRDTAYAKMHGSRDPSPRVGPTCPDFFQPRLQKTFPLSAKPQKTPLDFLSTESWQHYFQAAEMCSYDMSFQYTHVMVEMEFHGLIWSSA